MLWRSKVTLWRCLAEKLVDARLSHYAMPDFDGLGFWRQGQRRGTTLFSWQLWLFLHFAFDVWRSLVLFTSNTCFLNKSLKNIGKHIKFNKNTLNKKQRKYFLNVFQWSYTNSLDKKKKSEIVYLYIRKGKKKKKTTRRLIIDMLNGNLLLSFKVINFIYYLYKFKLKKSTN